MWNKGKFLMLGLAVGLLIGIIAARLEMIESSSTHEAAAFVSGEMVGAYGNDPELDAELCSMLPSLDHDLSQLSGFDSDRWIASRMVKIHKGCALAPRVIPSPKMGLEPDAN